MINRIEEHLLRLLKYLGLATVSAGKKTASIIPKIIHSQDSELKKRVLMGAIMTILITTAIGVGKNLYNITILAIAILSAMEFTSLASTKNSDILPHTNNQLLIFFYCLLPAASMIYIRSLEDGFKVTITMFAIVFCVDVAGYFVGRKFGKINILPNTSPKKTLEGSVAGIVASALIVTIFYFLFGSEKAKFGLLTVICFAIFASIVAQIGDLFESIIKRRIGVKNSGSIIPGHGGILDRMDGFVFVAPIFAIVCILTDGKIF